jgi:YbbR domain-containing protein
MGLAEATDALVLVVSEERGSVSAFLDGNMTRLDSAQSIEDTVTSHQTSRGLLNLEKLTLIDRPTSLQVAGSLLMAAVFWIVLTGSNKEIIERSLTLPIDYSAPVNDLVVVGERVEEARVRVTGPRSAINDFMLTQPSLKIDLSTMSEGTQTALIGTDHINSDKISLLGTTPAQVEVTLTKFVSISVPVSPQLVGSLPPNRKLKKVSVVPSHIKVLAPPAIENGAQLSIITTPVYLNSIQASSRIFCKIIAPPNIQPMTKPWQDVEVIIEVESELSRGKE